MNNKEYELISLEEEYPGIQGGCRWAVATDLSYDELFTKYCYELEMYKPLLLISKEEAEVFKNFHRNNKKHEMREYRKHDGQGYKEGQEIYQGADFLHDISSTFSEEHILSAFMIRSALRQLSKKQQRRFRLYFYYGYSEKEIALLEGVAQQSVHESIEAGLAKMKYMLSI
jgi:DNA-directed RNA polymerase specialized sigma subunit